MEGGLEKNHGREHQRHGREGVSHKITEIRKGVEEFAKHAKDLGPDESVVHAFNTLQLDPSSLTPDNQDAIKDGEEILEWLKRNRKLN